MANLYPDNFGASLDTARWQTAHARRARFMVVMAMACAFGLVALTTTLLVNLI